MSDNCLETLNKKRKFEQDTSDDLINPPKKVDYRPLHIIIDEIYGDTIGIASYYAYKNLHENYIFKYDKRGFVKSLEKTQKYDVSQLNYDYNETIFNDACEEKDVVLAKYFSKKDPKKFTVHSDENGKILWYSINKTNPKYDDCFICDNKNNANCKLSPCGHCFCDKCISEWGYKFFTINNNEKNLTCPFCREKIEFSDFIN